MDLSENYQFNYQKLFRFLSRTDRDGYMFVMADDYRFINQINAALLADLQQKEVLTAVVFLQKKEDEPLVQQIKNAAISSASIIVANLYEVIDNSPAGLTRLLHLNFSREELRQLQPPILFWVDAASLNIISNHAPDLFSQRRFTTIHFTGKVENPLKEALEKQDWKEFVSTEKFKETEAKIETLKRRLADAEASSYNSIRIATEIAIPLVKEYAALGFIDTAEPVLEKYIGFINQDNSIELAQLARVYYSLHNYPLAIETMQKANTVIERSASNNKKTVEWFTNVIDTTDWMRECGMLNEALTLLKEAEALFRIELTGFENYEYEWSQDFLSLFLERIGNVYFDLNLIYESIEFYEKCVDIRQQLATQNPRSERLQMLLSAAYTFLGESREKAGDLSLAKNYFEKSLDITQYLQTLKPNDEPLKRETFVCYNRLAGIALSLGDFERAKINYEQSLAIIKELNKNSPYNSQLKRDLAVEYFQLGELEEKQQNRQGSVAYFQSAYSIFKELSEANPLSKVLQSDVAEAAEKISALELGIQKP